MEELYPGGHRFLLCGIPRTAPRYVLRLAGKQRSGVWRWSKWNDGNRLPCDMVRSDFCKARLQNVRRVGPYDNPGKLQFSLCKPCLYPPEYGIWRIQTWRACLPEDI